MRVLSIAFIGHAESGKSTCIGKLLFKSNNVDKESLEKLEKASNEANSNIGNEPDRIKYAWISDKGEERERGHTIHPHFIPFRSDFRKFSIIDCPGNKKHIKNLIKGLSGANAAVLTVDASEGVFEASVNPKVTEG